MSKTTKDAKPATRACAVCRHILPRDAYRITADGHAFIHTGMGLAFACSADGERHSAVGAAAWRAALAESAGLETSADVAYEVGRDSPMMRAARGIGGAS